MILLKITDGDTRLPSPRVPQAADDKVLDLNTFEGNADVTVLPWIGISTDNIVNLKLLGKDNNNSDCTIQILTSHKITETEKISGIKESLTREQLLTLKHNTVFEVVLELLPNSITNSPPIKFTALKLNLLQIPLITMENFENWPAALISSPGQFIEGTSMKIVHLSGSGTIAITKAGYGRGKNPYSL
ncbi:hypothetical protein [Pseudomonas sp. S11A4]|uniref:hypothetical protein n=1 Tax=Pseudomonas sp. S11A4 TaxID=1476791 RepID=UPI00215C4ED0|nr:hypothetical protein [Pseudomonas sp. S11A4]MCR8932400.1 hypothetical protein [Pseudomonas sp. S11A4]